jgi:hypothetical protein
VKTEGRWLHEPDVSEWVAQSRLNLLRALPDHIDEPLAQAAVKRYLTHVGAAVERLTQLKRTRSRTTRPSRPVRDTELQL